MGIVSSFRLFCHRLALQQLYSSRCCHCKMVWSPQLAELHWKLFLPLVLPFLSSSYVQYIRAQVAGLQFSKKKNILYWKFHSCVPAAVSVFGKSSRFHDSSQPEFYTRTRLSKCGQIWSQDFILHYISSKVWL